MLESWMRLSVKPTIATRRSGGAAGTHPERQVRSISIVGVLTTIVVEARDLDTDELARRTYELEARPDLSGLQMQIERLVEHAHPDARLREFAGSVGTFAGRGKRIIARRLEDVGEKPGLTERPGQGLLFSA
jgi:hypothetical protein